MYKRIFAAAFLLCRLAGLAQNPLTLPDVQESAKQHYPLIRQRDLIRETASLSIENLGKGFLPQVSLNGQATYQSEVTAIKIPVPGFSVDPLNKDQYKILADISQLVYDGGLTRKQKEVQQLSASTEQQKLEVELYKLRERINQLFLGILFLDEQMKQVELVKNDLDNGIRRVEAQVNNGVTFRSSLNVLKAERLKADQRLIELKASRKGYLEVLGLFIQQELPETTTLKKPEAVQVEMDPPLQRPELKLFDAQQKLFGSQAGLIDARNQPKASLFWQGGFGRPGLNFLRNEFDFFYTAGLRLNWSLSGLYTRKKEKKIVSISQQTVDLQKETFLLNTRTQLKQQSAEIIKLRQLVDTDKEIIGLREKVKDAARAQLENGVITANDYLREVNAEDQSRQALIIHQVQLLQAQISYQTTAGQ